jgi:hypothetical protein
MSRVLLILVCSAVGCASMKTTFSAGSSAAAPAIPASKVTVIDLRRDDKPVQLPDGVAIKDRWSYETRDVQLVPGFPTADQPHQRIGDLQVEVGNAWSHATPDDWIEQLAAEAGAHGANTLLVLNTKHAVALRLSTATAPRPAADQLLTEARATLAGYQAGPPQVIQLGDVASRHIDARAGTCYALAVVLEASAEWSQRVRDQGLEARLVPKGGWLSFTPASGKPLVPQRAPVAPRSAVIELACAINDTSTELLFREQYGSDPLRELGTGAGKLVVLEKTLDAPALEALKRRELAGFMFHTIPDHDDAATAERDCIVCAGSVGTCRTGNVTACAPLQDCLLKRGHDTRVSYCLRER